MYVSKAGEPMGVLSEKMSSEQEHVEAGDPDQASYNANTDPGSIGGSQDPRRASPVSSEGSTTGRPRSATIGSSVAALDASSGGPTLADSTEHEAVTAISLLAEGVTRHAASNQQQQKLVPTAGRIPSSEKDEREVDHENALAASYQSLEAKLRNDENLAHSAPDEVGQVDGNDSSAPASAATAAAAADDGPPQFITTKPASSGKKSGQRRRRGKWTVEEEAYVARVIQDFNSGFLDAPAGTTLRTFLSDKLNCDPMRITKKFTGEACIGKRVFHPAIRSANNAAAIDKAQVSVGLHNMNRSLWESKLHFLAE